MSRSPEHLLYDRLKEAFPPNWHLTRIESSTANGIPDINMIVGGSEVWVECKVGEQATLRKEQWAWMQRRVACEGTCLVILETKAGYVVFWIHGFSPHTVGSKGITLTAEPMPPALNKHQLVAHLRDALT